MKAAAAKVERIFRERGMVLTLGAEPTCVPLNPRGAEWSFAATGPTKPQYARRLAKALIAEALPGGAVFYSTGKIYPGEINPRWALHVVARRDGSPLVKPRRISRRATLRSAQALLRRLAAALGLPCSGQQMRDPLRRGAAVLVWPLDHDERRGWFSPSWRWPAGASLLQAEGAAGLRLPWSQARGRGARRALTITVQDGVLEIFLPPLWQEPWMELLETVDALWPGDMGCHWSGHVPEDLQGIWRGLVISGDPGVLEINLPPCADWMEYDGWLRALDRAQKACGLRTWKRGVDGAPTGTGGGHHLLFGGTDLVEHPLFTRPGWIASMMRYWQHHPSLSYLFSGRYVGPSSQAPRADESGKTSQDLEMTYAWLEELPAGHDHRAAMTDALLYLHSDASGNTHRAEISCDKLWNTRFPGGARGLLEFRALESLPRARWSSAVALLWRALAALLLVRPCRGALRDFGGRLHDAFLLPEVLWRDFVGVLSDLAQVDLGLDEKIFRSIWHWRFPVLLQTADGLTVRRALEPWPLLGETPPEGGTTSRFVDTSVQRLEFAATADFARRHRVSVNGRRLPLRAWREGCYLSGLRYRASALSPSLHPGLRVDLPLVVEIAGPRGTRGFVLGKGRAKFVPTRRRVAPGAPCRAVSSGDLCYDLRLA
jgi:uncharacterized protein (DUF2126 family)